MRKGNKAPEPTALKILKGNPGHRPLNRNEPQPERGVPSCPSWLSAEAKRMWREVVPQLQKMRVLTKADRSALVKYCELWADWKELRLWLRKNGNVYNVLNDDGSVRYIRAVPQFAMADKLATQLLRLEQEFGLTPSARSRLQVLPETKAKSDKMRFFEVKA